MIKAIFISSIAAFQKIVQALAGLAIALVIVKFLTPESQGFYYTAGSLLSLYAILDLSLSSYVFKKSAVLSSNINSNYNIENRIFKYWAYRLYQKAGIASAIIIYLFGYGILKNQQTLDLGENWLLPWTITSLLLYLHIPAIGFITIIEGTGAIFEAYSLKIASNIFAGTLTCLAIILGYGLYAQAMPFVTTAFLMYLWKKERYKDIFLNYGINSEFYKTYNNEALTSIRGAICRSLGNYAFLNVPIIVSAITSSLENTGRLGLSIVVANIGGAIAMSQITAKMPSLIQSIHKRGFRYNKITIIKNFVIANFLYALGFLTLLILMKNYRELIFLDRILNAQELIILFFAFIAYINIYPMHLLLEAANIKSKAFEITSIFIILIFIIIKYIEISEITELTIVILMAVFSLIAFIFTIVKIISLDD